MKQGVVLLNMGGPNNLDEVGVFLNNMFNDKNIIPVKNDLLRRFIAFVIKTSRKSKSQNNYKLIGGKSPIVENTQRLVDKLNGSIEKVIFTYAMRYTPPFADEAIEELKELKIDNLVIIPLYPHYSTTTTKSSIEDFISRAYELNFTPKNIRYINRFYEDVRFNKIVINDIKTQLGSRDAKNFELIFSAHSLPKSIIEKGDSYKHEIEQHTMILTSLLKDNNMEFANITIAYQSKLGPAKWIEPSLESVIKQSKNRAIIVYPISFIIDNSETILELAIEYKELAERVGLISYEVVSCPNDSDSFAEYIINKGNFHE